jgi:hypothetical protein
MLSLVLLLFEPIVKIISLHIVTWSACHLSREYVKAVLKLATECLTIAESHQAARAIDPARI